MTSVFKYPVALEDPFTVGMPRNAEILAVQSQYGRPVMWARVRTEHPVTVRTFRIFGTGHPIPTEHKLNYIDTFQMEGGNLVFHVFEQE